VRSFKLEDYSELLAAIESPGLDLILVGGHAVSVYGYDYHRSCPALDAYLPFLSKDADLIGTVASGMQLASRLNAQWKKESTKGGLRGLSIGHIELPNVPGAKVEILGQILGVKTEDVRNTAVVKSFRGHQFKVINPFLLYEAKATNVVQIDQIKESGSRRDRSQLGIMGIVVNKVLSELASTQGAERALVKASGRLLNFWLSSNGAALVRCNLADPKTTLPLRELTQHPSPSIQNFVTQMIPRFWGTLAERTASVPEPVVTKLESEGTHSKIVTGSQRNDPPTTSEFLSQLRQSSQDEPGDSRSQGCGIKP
jgi:hypothetical protein